MYWYVLNLFYILMGRITVNVTLFSDGGTMMVRIDASSKLASHTTDDPSATFFAATMSLFDSAANGSLWYTNIIIINCFFTLDYFLFVN